MPGKERKPRSKTRASAVEDGPASAQADGVERDAQVAPNESPRVEELQGSLDAHRDDDFAEVL